MIIEILELLSAYLGLTLSKNCSQSSSVVAHRFTRRSRRSSRTRRTRWTCLARFTGRTTRTRWTHDALRSRASVTTSRTFRSRFARFTGRPVKTHRSSITLGTLQYEKYISEQFLMCNNETI